MHGWEFWRFQDKSFLILQDIQHVLLALLCVWDSGFRKTSDTLMPLQAFLTSGKGGTLLCRPGCGIIYIFLWVETEKVN